MTTTKLTGLTIAPERPWSAVGVDNPLKAVVKLASKNSTVECVLSDDAMRRMLALCADEIARQAEANVQEFVRAVSTIEVSKDAALIGAD